MTIQASTTGAIAGTPQQVLEFVLDLERYKDVDSKIVRVGKIQGPDDDGRGSVKLWGRMAGMPPAPDKQDFVLERWSRLTFTGASGQPGRLVFDFVGTFECEPIDATTTNATHAYEFRFKGPFKLMEKRLQPWLQRQVETEIAELAAVFGAGGSQAG